MNDIISIYNKIFLVKGNIKVVTNSPPIEYIVTEIERYTSCRIQNGLHCIRNMTDSQLIDLVLKAVAGNFVTGTYTVSENVCNIGIDPVTGYFTLIDETTTKYTTLVVILIVLFITLGYILYKDEIGKTAEIKN